MKYLLLSDIHVDVHFVSAVSKDRLVQDDPDESVTIDTLEYMWSFYKIPDTEGLILAGDYSNDYLTFTRMVTWLSKKYKRVILVLGNHDLTVRGGTPSKANLQFASSEQKYYRMRDFCNQFDNILFVDEESTHTMLKYGIGGCTGFCDFKCEPPTYGLDPATRWRRSWYDGKHWRYFGQEPGLIWNHADAALSKIVSFNPKVVVTHFTPYQMGVPYKYRTDPWNFVYFFNAEKYLEQMGDDTYWFCGHTHGRMKTEYVNSKGNHIHIWCNPIGYPGDREDVIEFVDYTGEKLLRGSVEGNDKAFIIEL